jgi:hypothetical protein
MVGLINCAEIGCEPFTYIECRKAVHVQKSFMKGLAMNLILRILRFLALSILHLLFELTIVFLRFLVLPVMLAFLRIIRDLIFFSLIATLNGPRQHTTRLASDWTRQLIELGAPRDQIDLVFVICQLAVGSILGLGWFVTAIFTVAILRVVFGIFI